MTSGAMTIEAVILYILLILSWTIEAQSTLKIDAIVAKDGTGNYSTIMDAVAAAPKLSASRYIIKIKRGKYYENVIVEKEKINISFIGDGIDQTIITGNKSFGGGIKTYETATVGIAGAGFMAMYITIENTAGPENHQAVALRSDVESVFYHCKFLGYQDTLYPKSGRQFYRECQVYGTVDFIFGDAGVVLQNCAIYARLPTIGQSNVIIITAQGRKEPSKNSGTIIHNCTILPTDELRNSSTSLVQVYLGRPWNDYSRTIVMQSFIDKLVNSKGWLAWNGNLTNTGTLYYAEYQNRGPGAATDKRVQWSGYHVINTTEASKFTVRNFISGNEWLPSMGIPYIPDLI